VDLGTSQGVETIVLTNTHNRQSNDRGTRDFIIRGSNTLADITGDASTAAIILTGKLTSSTSNADFDTLVPQDIFSSDRKSVV